MTFDLSHWNNPRAAISTVYQNNDFAYATHGGYAAILVYSYFNLCVPQTKEMTILDFGCGTARMARVLTPLFKHVYAYDPNTHCIAEASKERDKANLKPNNLTVTTSLNDIPECDIAFSINVMEHLHDNLANKMIDELVKHVKGNTLLWYSISKNKNIIDKYLSKETLARNKDALTKGSSIMIDMFNFRELTKK